MAIRTDQLCADCAGYDYEWMRTCPKHKGVQLCRGCQCPYCLEEEPDYDDDGPLDLEDQLERALNAELPANQHPPQKSDV